MNRSLLLNNLSLLDPADDVLLREPLDILTKFLSVVGVGMFVVNDQILDNGQSFIVLEAALLAQPIVVTLVPVELRLAMNTTVSDP